MSVPAEPAGFDPKTAFPVPVPDADTQPFWDGCAEGQLRIQRCGGCSRWIWQPRPLCPDCHRPDPEWTVVSGDGRIVSWTVMRPPTLPAYADKVPFVVLLVELDEGVRLLGYLVDGAGAMLQTDGEAEGVAMDRRVAVRFHDQAGAILPSWTLAP